MLLFSTKPSSSINSRDLLPIAAANGYPPNVDPCEPGANHCITSLVDIKQETGSNPPPSAFPRIRPSGRMELCSKANISPVLPRPD